MFTYQVSYFDVSYKCLQKHQHSPYEEYKTNNYDVAKTDAILVSETSEGCVRVKNTITGKTQYYENGGVVYTFEGSFV